MQTASGTGRMLRPSDNTQVGRIQGCLSLHRQIKEGQMLMTMTVLKKNLIAVDHLETCWFRFWKHGIRAVVLSIWVAGVRVIC